MPLPYRRKLRLKAADSHQGQRIWYLSYSSLPSLDSLFQIFWCILLLLSCLHLRAWVHASVKMHMPMFVYVCGPWCPSLLRSCLVFSLLLTLSVSLGKLARLAGQQAPWISYFSLLSARIVSTKPPHPALKQNKKQAKNHKHKMWVLGTELRSSHLQGKSGMTELPHHPLYFCFF